MGAGFIGDDSARAAVNSLNGMFSQNIAATFQQVEDLRKVYGNFLHRNAGDIERRQTLRFAALLLTDSLIFAGAFPPYPAANYKKWLRWLTWLHQQPAAAGNAILDGAQFQGDAHHSAAPHDLIMYVLAKALPPGGAGLPVGFTWARDNNGPLKAVATTVVDGNGTTIGYTIAVTSQGEDRINAAINSDDEDHMP